MPLTALKPSQIRKIAANSLVGNATGAEARGTSLSVSQVRTLLGLGTTDSPTFNTVTATTSVLTPLVNNTNAAALILGNSTYGVTVPGAVTTTGKVGIGGAVSGTYMLRIAGTANSSQIVLDSPGVGNECGLLLYNAGSLRYQIFDYGDPAGFSIYNAGTASYPLRLNYTTNNATFVGSVTCAGITASGAVSAGTAVNGLPGIGGTTFLSGKSGTFEFSVQDYATGNGYIGTYNGTVKGITGYTTTADPRVVYGTTSDHDVMLWRNSTQKMRVYSTYVEFANTIKTTAGLLSGAFVGYTGSNGATGSCEVASVSGTGPVYLWTEYGLGVRGCLGYAAGSTTLSYRAAGSSMATGTEVFSIGSTGNVTCAGITASGTLNIGRIQNGSGASDPVITLTSSSMRFGYVGNGESRAYLSGGALLLGSNYLVAFSNTSADALGGSLDAGYARNAAGVLEINNGTLISGGGSYGSLKCASVTANGGATITGGGASGTAGAKIGSHSTGIGGLWSSAVTPSTTNYTFAFDGGSTFINAPNAAGLIYFNAGGGSIGSLSTTTLSLPSVALSCAGITASGSISLTNGGTIVSDIRGGSYNGEISIGSTGAGGYFNANNVAIVTPSNGRFAWASTTTSTGNSTYDAAISRISAGVIGFGTGAAGSTAAEIRCGTITASGSLNLTQGGTVVTDIRGGSYNGEISIGSTGAGGYFNTNNVAIQVPSNGRFVWASTTTNNGNSIYDTGISRIAAGVIGFGTGAAASTSAEIRCGSITASGSLNLTQGGTVVTDIRGGSYNGEISIGSTGAGGYFNTNNVAIVTPSNGRFAWASTTTNNGNSAYDAAISRISAGVIGFGTGAAGNTSAEIRCGSITASGNVSYAQGLSTGTVTKSANYTTTADDYCVNVTANSIDITFETAVGCANREHEVINSGSGVVTLKTTSAQTISGNASGALTLAQWKSIRVKSDGSNWLIMSQVT